MVARAIWRALTLKDYNNLIGASSKKIDFIDAAAKVEGILTNNNLP
jgi:hypothetical protein